MKKLFFVLLIASILFSCNNNSSNEESRLYISKEEIIIAGAENFIRSQSPETARYHSLFESDGDTGYFYAIDFKQEDDIFKDALYIYDIYNEYQQNEEIEIKIGWSRDGFKSILFINDNPKAFFDFSKKRGFCISGIPEKNIINNSTWSKQGHLWDERKYQKIIR